MMPEKTKEQYDQANEYIQKKKEDADWAEFDNAMGVAFKSGVICTAGIFATLLVLGGIGIAALRKRRH